MKKMNNLQTFEKFNVVKGNNHKEKPTLFAEGISSDDPRISEITSKIRDAAYSYRTFGSLTKQAAFINGANWAVHNLTSDEISLIKDKGDPEGHSYFGL